MLTECRVSKIKRKYQKVKEMGERKTITGFKYFLLDRD